MAFAFHNAMHFADELRGLDSDEERKEKALFKYGWDMLPQEENCKNSTSPNSGKQEDVLQSCRRVFIRIEKLNMNNLVEELNQEKEKDKDKEDGKVKKIQ